MHIPQSWCLLGNVGLGWEVMNVQISMILERIFTHFDCCDQIFRILQVPFLDRFDFVECLLLLMKLYRYAALH